MNCSFAPVINDIVDVIEEAAFDEPNLCENHPKVPVDMVLTARACARVDRRGWRGPGGAGQERASFTQECQTNSGNYTRP